MDNPNTERVDEIVKENEEVKKARDVLYVMSEDEKLKRLAFLKERYSQDEAFSKSNTLSVSDKTFHSLLNGNTW